MDEYLTLFSLSEVTDPRTLPDQPMVYAAVQGRDVITVGMSKSRQRLRALMGEDSLHLKKALVALCARERPHLPIRFYCRCMTDSNEARALEAQMHAALGAMHGTPSTSTCIDGVTGYSSALRHLLGDTGRFSEREQDLIELVLANGDIYCSLIRLERFRASTVALFGDYYVRPRPAPRPVLPTPPVAVPRAAVPEVNRTNPLVANRGSWHEATEHYWKFRRRDWIALQDPECLGFRLSITGPFGRAWLDGAVVLEIPKDDANAGWRHLAYLADLPSFAEKGENTSSRRVPDPLRACMRRCPTDDLPKRMDAPRVPS